jgi:polysaccharide biosynthesis transport protein
MNHLTSSRAVAAESTLLQFTVSTLLVALRCWWKIVTPLAVVCALTAAGAVYLLHTPTYTADAWLLIKEKPDVILREIDRGPQRFIQNQLEIIRSPRLLGPLASNPEIVATPELRLEQDVARALAKRIKTTPRGESDIYSVSFTSRSPEKAELIVREVVNAYLTFNRKLDSEHQTQILRLLQDQREARYEEMTQLREKVRSMSMELTGIDPFRATRSIEEQSKAHSSMATLQADIVRYEVAQDILAAHIKAEEEKQAEDEALTADEQESIEKQLKSDPQYVALQNRIDQLERKQADFERTGKNLDQNPLYRQTQRELEAELAGRTEFAAEFREELGAEILEKRNATRGEKLRALKAEFATGATRLKLLNEKFEERMGTAKQFAGDSLGLEFNKAKLEQVTKIHDEISARILAVTTEQRAPDRVMAFKEATLPLRPDEPIPWKKIGPVAALAFLFPFGLVVLWEHFFRRVSCRSQIEALERIPVLAEVTALPSRKRNLPLRTRSRQREALLFAESVDSLRTYLSFTESVHDLGLVAVTSAVSGEGKTSLAAQLGMSIEEATGDATLLIDGDMRAPNLHETFEVPLSPGLAEVLSKKCSLEDAIKPSSHANLFILPAGQLVTNPHRLLSNGAFEELLQQLRTRFRHMIIDTPPILPASEALLMARSADAAILCMRRDYTRLDQVQDAHQRMTAAGVKMAGAVLNGIPVNHYARKYGSYPYGRIVDAAASAT